MSSSSSTILTPSSLPPAHSSKSAALIAPLVVILVGIPALLAILLCTCRIRSRPRVIPNADAPTAVVIEQPLPLQANTVDIDPANKPEFLELHLGLAGERKDPSWRRIQPLSVTAVSQSALGPVRPGARRSSANISRAREPRSYLASEPFSRGVIGVTNHDAWHARQASRIEAIELSLRPVVPEEVEVAVAIAMPRFRLRPRDSQASIVASELCLGVLRTNVQP